MSSSDASGWPSMHDLAENQQDFAAAESLLQHSRFARSNDTTINEFAATMTLGSSDQAAQNYVLEPSLMDVTSSVQYQPQFSHPFQPPSAPQEHVPQTFAASLGPNPPTPDMHGTFDQQMQAQQTQIQTPTLPPHGHRGCNSSAHGHRDPHSADGSEPASPAIQRSSKGATSWTPRSKDDNGAPSAIKEDVEEKPAWSELKTKAGKERKRLPLACIACRRKKIRCSGEKPACKHCQRSRVPCVYKVTTRKAAPRTDYMAMLDRRLKRMEERVIKIIPKDEANDTATIPRAVLKPTMGHQSTSGKKRAAEEAFGPQLDEWAKAKTTAQPQKGMKTDESKINTEGAEHLPSKEIQEHLSEVFFDCLYGQTYHLMHKPSYMRRLRADTLPPVLVLAVCSISARFSTHPEINSEPAFLRGENWAAPARTIALARYDEPNITILTVLLLLGLHEFGTCHGGRSWMLAGMAGRMAYALQLHRELDHDPLGTRNDKKSELSFTDREIRRRTMWACFLMDRFSASGTERPMFADEESIKVQLPIRETHFQMDIPGPTESLDGRVPNPITTDTGRLADAKANMGVAAYMIRAIALWGRVIKHLNMGGKEKDPLPIWDAKSQYSELKKEAADFASTLPPELQNTPENLHQHAAEKLANQFIFLHVASNQVILFLHRIVIPTSPGARNASQMPKSFLAEAAPIAVKAAAQISLLLSDALEHNAVAPFISYCAFLSGTVHVWGIFSKNPSLEASCKQSLGSNIKYLSKMERYWGMCPFMVKNLKDIYRQHADASLKGTDERAIQDAAIFQYGDWFTRYPRGVSRTDYEDPTKIKKEPGDDAALSQKSDLQTVENFFQTLSPANSKATINKKSSRKNNKIASAQQSKNATQLPHPQLHMDTTPQQHATVPMTMPDPNQPPMTPYTPTHPQSQPQLYPQPCNNNYPTPQDLMPLQTAANTAFLPQLDRSLVYDAYAGANDSPGSAIGNIPQFTPSSAGPMWDGSGMDVQQQQTIAQGAMPDVSPAGGYLSDMQTSAWFIPFNMMPPGVDNLEKMGPTGS